MKQIKKIIAIICLSAMLICCFSFSASALVFSDGDFGYEMNSYTKEMTLVSYDGADSTVTIPGTYGDYPVTKLGKTALSGNADMQVLNMPTTMRKIEEGSLSECSALESVRFPTYITSLGTQVCLNCTSLQSAYVYAEIDTLPEYSFAGCHSLTFVDLNYSISAIGAYAFQDCSALSNVAFLSGITSIGRYAFEGTAISRLTIPKGMEEIPEYAFANCQSLSRADIPAGVTSIDATAFYNCPNLTLGVYFGSCAYHYAIENSIPYVLLDNALLGDANGDGVVNINDVTTIQRFKADMETLEGINLHAADVNGDGNVTIEDATILQRFFAEYDDIPYSIGEVMTQ